MLLNNAENWKDKKRITPYSSNAIKNKPCTKFETLQIESGDPGNVWESVFENDFFSYNVLDLLTLSTLY